MSPKFWGFGEFLRKLCHSVIFTWIMKVKIWQIFLEFFYIVLKKSVTIPVNSFYVVRAYCVEHERRNHINKMLEQFTKRFPNFKRLFHDCAIIISFFWVAQYRIWTRILKTFIYYVISTSSTLHRYVLTDPLRAKSPKTSIFNLIFVDIFRHVCIT